MPSDRHKPKTLEEIERSLVPRARHRAQLRREKVEQLLAAGEGRMAVNEALAGIQSELAGRRKGDPGAASAVDADIARTALRLAAQVTVYVPAAPKEVPGK
jgi:hypothetical protein